LNYIGIQAFNTNDGRKYQSINIYCEDMNHHNTIESLIEGANIPANTITYIWPGGEDADPPDED
jgi:hypothetical protein